MDKTYQSLIKQLNVYNHAYYTIDKPQVTDEEYDRLYDQLLQLEKLGFHSPISPTQRVGGEVLKGFEKMAHTVPMSSLDKAQNYEEVEKFIRDIHKQFPNLPITFTLELKFDGLAFVLHFDNGILVHARSRGNGKIGEVLTSQIKTIRSIPLSIPYKGKVEVQGEVYFPIDKFNAFNEKQLHLFHEKLEELPESLSEDEMKALREKYVLSNPRNGASGALRNQDPKVTASRPLDAFLYNVPYIVDTNFATQQDMMQFLKEQGLKVNSYFKTFTTGDDIQETIDSIIAALEKMKAIRPTLNYDIDGMVLKVDDIALREEIGSTRKHPKWAVAFKFEAAEKATLLLEVRIEIGRTGKLTPVAIFEAIDFEGVTVTKATLNNFDDIKRKGVKLGSIIIVRRSNDVIPEVVGTYEGTGHGEIPMPTHCPSCNSVLVKDGVHLFCPNRSDCPAQAIGRLTHFGSRDAMNIDTFSEKTAEQLYEAGLVKDFSDLYTLQAEELEKLERFGKRKAEKLLSAIDASKERPLSSVLYALGIRHAGLGTVERLLNHFNSLDEIMNATVDELTSIDDIGEVVAQSLYDYFRNPKHLDLLQSLQNSGVRMHHEAVEKASNRFEGMTIVITGKLSRPRKEIEQYIKENGGKTSGSVSKNTSLLVAGEDAGSKLEKAEKAGVKVISEEELYAM